MFRAFRRDMAALSVSGSSLRQEFIFSGCQARMGSRRIAVGDPENNFAFVSRPAHC